MPNRLQHEKSPYLLQHANNPVDWYSWGEEAFAKARAEDKPIFLSVGYSTCHWCHVMERESFENGEIAAILNRHFVSIKLDREERPDVDRIYMLFVQATTGGGGWPMSVFLTPDLKPFYGGTYFPPDSRYGRPGFGHVLEQIAQAWALQRGKVIESSASIVGELERHTDFAEGRSAVDTAALDSIYSYLRRTYDSRYGGFGNAPKFPRPAIFSFLFRYHHRTRNPEALEMALHTLREMAKGGMNDQLGGGFHRYSVDERWFVPHFEKMLYDQAQLAVAYLEAFQITGDALYAGIAHDILGYVLRDMTHAEGGFYSAEDADSVIDPAHPHEKGEGAFYIWKYEDLDSAVARAFGCRTGGNVDNDPHGEFTGRNILYQGGDPVPAEVKEKLLAVRVLRPRPHLDDKILTSWNGLMISAFAKGGQALGDDRYTKAAARAASFIRDRLYSAATGLLQRRWRDGDAAIDGFLDDYAFFAQGLIDLFEATFEKPWLDLARRLTSTMIDRFEDRDHGAFFNTPEASDLLLRIKEDYDGAEPAANSVAVSNLLRLAHYDQDARLKDTAARTLAAFSSRLNNAGMTLPQMASSFMMSLAPESQIAISGTQAEAFLRALHAHFRPYDAVLLNDTRFPTVNGQTTAYVCENFTCQAPTTDLEQFRELLK